MQKLQAFLSETWKSIRDNKNEQVLKNEQAPEHNPRANWFGYEDPFVKRMTQEQLEEFDRWCVDNNRFPRSAEIVFPSGRRTKNYLALVETEAGMEWLERLAKRVDPEGKWDDIEIEIIYDDATPATV